MYFKDALKELEKGCKISRPSLKKEDISLCNFAGKLTSLRKCASLLSINMETIQDEELNWIVEGTPMTFFDMLFEVRRGKIAKKEGWTDEYLQLSITQKEVYFFHYETFPYFLTLDDVTATDWEIV